MNDEKKNRPLIPWIIATVCITLAAVAILGGVFGESEQERIEEATNTHRTKARKRGKRAHKRGKRPHKHGKRAHKNAKRPHKRSKGQHKRGKRPHKHGKRPRRQKAPRRPDVLLLVIDTLRADPLGCYGSELGLTPNIDAYAESGARFDRAIAPSSWTVPSMASMMTGLWPEQHGLNKGIARRGRIFGQTTLPEHHITLAEAFQERGYHTAGVVANAHLSRRHGFAQGFNVFRNVGFAPAGSVIKWIRKKRRRFLSNRPRFMWIHLFDPHHPYRPRHRWFGKIHTSGRAHSGVSVRELNRLATDLFSSKMLDLMARNDTRSGTLGLHALQTSYLSEVGHSDRTIVKLRELLKVRDNTIVVIASDHGEEFREHGNLGHRVSLYSELVRVPLIISYPRKMDAGQFVKRPVSLVDIYPTLLELAGLPESEQEMAGLSLVSGRRFVAHPNREIFSSVFHKNRTIRSVTSNSLRLIHDQGNDHFELFDEDFDPFDAHNIIDSRRKSVARFKRILRNFEGLAEPSDEASHSVILSDEQVEQLRRLGYIED